MPSVLLIDGEEWVRDLLAGAVREAGYEVLERGTAEEGFELACSAEPDCIVCEIDLPDHDGYWVARNVRAETSDVSVVPMVLLSKRDDPKERAEALLVGADAFMTKPFHVGEVLAQIDALVKMAARLQGPRELPAPPPDSCVDEGAAIQGELAEASIATLLTVLAMEKRTGLFEVASRERRARLELVEGFVVDGAIDGVQAQAADALRSMIGLDGGTFSFWPLPAVGTPAQRWEVGNLLVQVCRPEPAAASSAPGRAVSPGVLASARPRGKPIVPLPKPPLPTLTTARPKDGAIDVETDLSSFRPPPGRPK